MNWNWFFSTYAQCAAALIGIIAAFIISRLLNENEKKDSIKQKIDEYKLEYSNLKELLSHRRFNWYNIEVIQKKFFLGNFIKNEDVKGFNPEETEIWLYDLLPNIFYSKDNYSLIELYKKAYSDNLSNEVIEDLNIEIDRLKKSMTRKDKNQVYKQYPSMLSGLYRKNSMFETPKIDINELANDIQDEYNEIVHLEVQCYDLINRFKSAKQNIKSLTHNARQLSNVIGVLILGFILCVLFPMSLLPLDEKISSNFSWNLLNIWANLRPIHWILFIFLTIVIEGIQFYFLYFVFKILREYHISNNSIISDYIKIEGYDDFFINPYDAIKFAQV